MEWASTGPNQTSASEPPMMTSEEVLRRLTIGDPAFCRTVMATGPGESSRVLDDRGMALLHLGGLIATGSSGPLWQRHVGEALAAGLSFDEIVGSLLVLAPSIGIERLVEVAPHLARAIGYDVDAELERLGDPSPAPTRRP
jgi:4-carboxymuconolactone decarboxylase